MRRIGIISLVFAGWVIFTSCEKDSDEIITSIDALELESDASMETAYEEIDQVVEVGFAVAENQRIDRDELGSCAQVMHDEESKTITIDFGDGCEGRKGNTKSGQMLITYTDRLYVQGAVRTITFIDFYFNDVNVQGTRTVTNSSSTDTERQFTITLEGGRLDFGDGTFSTREANWTRTWYVEGKYVELHGQASGINVNGLNYSSTISTDDPLTFMRDCFRGLPVSGEKILIVGDDEAVMDFGDGECDRIVTITLDGETTEEEITPRRGKKTNS